MMAQYKLELGLPASAEPIEGSVSQLTEAFQNAPTSIKKKALFELVALACADNEYANTEHGLLTEICSSLHLDNSYLVPFRKYVLKLTELYSEINNLMAE